MSSTRNECSSSLPAHVPHRFVSVAEPLDILVLFAAAKPPGDAQPR